MRSWEKSMIAEDAIDREVERQEATQELVATKRFVSTMITGNGASEFDQNDDLEDAIQGILEVTDDLEGTPSTIFTFQVRDAWDANALVFEVSRREPRRMLAPGIVWPNTYDQIIVYTQDGSTQGTFRNRIPTNDGPAIWVTGMFEHFVPIEDIVSIEEAI